MNKDLTTNFQYKMMIYFLHTECINKTVIILFLYYKSEWNSFDFSNLKKKKSKIGLRHLSERNSIDPSSASPASLKIYLKPPKTNYLLPKHYKVVLKALSPYLQIERKEKQYKKREINCATS